MPDPEELVERSNHLIDNAQFTTLATRGPDHDAWASTVNYVALREPLRLLWYSSREARHSRNIEREPRVSGSVFLTGLPGFGLDGAQFTGTAHAVEPDGLAGLRTYFYERKFPDPAVRQEWELPLDAFQDDGSRRFYLLRVDAWWLLDIDQWLIDKNDRRVPVPLKGIECHPAPDSVA